MVKTFFSRLRAQQPASTRSHSLKRTRFQTLRRAFLLTLAAALPLLGTQLPRSAQAQGATFFCGNYQGTPATLVRSRNGSVPMILWNSGDFNRSGWNDQRRCDAVSTRLQNYHNNGKLRYLRTGSVGLYPVICVANQRGGSCPESQVVVTLMPGTRSATVYEQLRALASGANVAPVQLSGSDQFFFFDRSNPADGEATYYMDVPQWLYALDNGPTSQSLPSSTQTLANFNFQELIPSTAVPPAQPSAAQIVVPENPNCDRPQTIEDYAQCWGSEE